MEDVVAVVHGEKVFAAFLAGDQAIDEENEVGNPAEEQLLQRRSVFFGGKDPDSEEHVGDVVEDADLEKSEQLGV